MNTTKPRVITVTGPTASGKSALAVHLSKVFGGEVISSDSMQIYRGMNIGTAKPDEGEMQGIPHHLLDVRDPSESFSAADYKTLAEEAAADILARGKTPVFCGGTGLYLHGVMNISDYAEELRDDDLRARLFAREESDLWQELLRLDPESAEKIHQNNKKRVVRALEICLLSGKTKTEADREKARPNDKYEFISLTLDARDRQVLYRRIDDRVDAMMAAGLPEEVKGLLEAGLLIPGTTACQAIGYKEMIAWAKGEMTLDAAAAEIKQATRRYAKRQLTWFRRYPEFHTLYIDDYPDAPALFAAAEAVVRAK